jgi:hypothetical protein
VFKNSFLQAKTAKINCLFPSCLVKSLPYRNKTNYIKMDIEEGDRERRTAFS